MNLKSFLFSGLLALLSVAFVYGQSDVTKKGNVTIGVRGGLTIPGFTGGANDPVSSGYSTATRLGAGIFAEFKLSNLFSIQPMLEYSQEGAKRNGMQALIATGTNPQFAGAFTKAWQDALSTPEGGAQLAMLTPMLPAGFPTAPQYLYANANRDAKMDYLMLPILAKFGWNFTKSSPWRVYVDAGPYIGLLLKAKNTVSINGSVYADQSGTALIQIPDAVISQIPPSYQQSLKDGVSLISDGVAENMASNLSGTQDFKEQLHPFNWGLEGNVGLQYQINQHNRVFVEVGGNYGLMNIQKSTGNGQYLNGKNNIGAATAMVGYGYTL